MKIKVGSIVVVRAGRRAGKKGVITRILGDDRVSVVGIDSLPVESPDYVSERIKRKNSYFRIFAKPMNMKHLVITGYMTDIAVDKLDVDMETYENVEAKKAFVEGARTLLQDAYKQSKSKYLFKNLTF